MVQIYPAGHKFSFAKPEAKPYKVDLKSNFDVTMNGKTEKKAWTMVYDQSFIVNLESTHKKFIANFKY